MTKYVSGEDKTNEAVTVLYTLLDAGIKSVPIKIHKAIYVTPTVYVYKIQQNDDCMCTWIHWWKNLRLTGGGITCVLTCNTHARFTYVIELPDV